jgi:hypothetical protein
MYLRYSTRRKDGTKHTYWRTVRSVRRNGKVVQETAAQLGELDARGRARARPVGAHHVLGLLRQRVYALALGYEDLNDHTTLRADPGLQTAVEQDAPLASSPIRRGGPLGEPGGSGNGLGDPPGVGGAVHSLAHASAAAIDSGL